MMGPVIDELKVFTGNANRELATAVCDYLNIPLGRAEVFKFANDNTFVRILENVRQRDVFIVQPTSYPVNDNLMELLIMIDACKRASAGRITAVVPYYGYGRTDKKDQPRVPITARLVADLLTAAGADRLVTVDLHAGQIQGFFNIPVDNLFATPVLLRYLRERIGNDPATIISPDAGGVERARAFAKRLDGGLAIIDKRRSGPNEVTEMNIIGEVRSRIAILVDDMVDTAGTLCSAGRAAMDAGAQEVLAVCTHAVLSGPAIERLEQSQIMELIVTDTITQGERARNCKKIRVLSVASLIGEAIRRTHHEESISSLFI
jgi:ribose-phosphate pyrophosphokinase